MSLYEWLMTNIFNFEGAAQYTDYIVFTLCVITIVFVLLVAKALLGVFNIFFK